MKPVIVARLRPFIDAWATRATYRILGRGDRWALLLIRADDRIDPAAWTRKAGE